NGTLQDLGALTIAGAGSTRTLATAITLSSYTQAEGTFTAGTHAVTISNSVGGGGFTISGGTFNAPSSTLTVADPVDAGTTFNIFGGTFNHNSGTVQFTGQYMTANVPSSVNFNNVTIAMDNGTPFHIATGKTMTINGALTLTSGQLGYVQGSGTLDAKGAVAIGAAFGGSTLGDPGTNLLIDGAGDQSFVVGSG